MAGKGEGDEKVRNVVVSDVTPLSLGIGMNDGQMSVYIPRNTPMPARKEKIIKTVKDNQTSAMFAVYEGERSKATETNMVGQVWLKGIPAAPRGAAEIKVCFGIDENGAINVSAEHIGSGVKNSITIANDKGRLSKKEIERMIGDAEKYKREDEEYRRKAYMRNVLENYAYDMRDTTRSGGGRIGAGEKEKIEKAFASTMIWLRLHKAAEADAECFNEKIKELRRIYLPIVVKIYLSPSKQKFVSIKKWIKSLSKCLAK